MPGDTDEQGDGVTAPTWSPPLAPSEPVGLTTAEARRLLHVHGPNHLVPERRPTWIGVWVLRPLADPMVVLLLIAGATYVALGDRVDAILVTVALVPIALVSLVLEARSERALERLRQLTAPTVMVWRDGVLQTIAAEEVVPGDLISVHEGDVIAADGTFVGGTQLMTDESALTGESQPVDKVVDGEEPAQRTLLAGTTVLSGSGTIRVTATGKRTQYGEIGTLVASLEPTPTPLERAIRRLVLQFGAIAAVFCVAVTGMEFGRGSGWAAALIAGVSLAIAAIPEEFPMVYTLYLSLGAWRLTRGKALVRRLAGVETLGSTTVICADKTGTLTLGQLDLVQGVAADGEDVDMGGASSPSLSAAARALLEAAVAACEPTPFDPLEQAILQTAATHGIDVARIHRGTLLQDYPFDPVHKYMSHVWREDGATRVYAKGSQEGILAHSAASDEVRQRMTDAALRLAAAGMRVIAVAGGTLPDGSTDRDRDETALRLLGVLGFSDPLRPGVVEALQECRQAGIRVIMITGDHPVTAHAVADALDLPHAPERPLATGDEIDALDDAGLTALAREVNIFARTRPEQKYRIVRALRAAGEVVAMTGDGINDAPALREADIGVAMAQRGTAVARESATLVLLDDNFATIVRAVRQGRRIYDNLQKAFAYLIAFHMPLLLTALLVPLLGAPLLLLPVHLIWLELVVHPTASLVFEADPSAPDIMRRPPRSPSQGFLGGMHPLWPLAQGVVLTVGVLALYLVRLGAGAPAPTARALAFATLIIGQVGLVLVARSPDRPVWRTEIRRNRTVAGVLVPVVLTLVLALYIPPVATLLHLHPFPAAEWGVVVGVAALGTLWTEPIKAWRGRRGRGHSSDHPDDHPGEARHP